MLSKEKTVTIVLEVTVMTFSEKLKLIRKGKGITQDELAEKLNVSRQAVTKWESGQHLVFGEVFS